MIYLTFGVCIFFFFNDTATTEIYTLSLHDALPISLEIAEALVRSNGVDVIVVDSVAALVPRAELDGEMGDSRSEEHTSELQSLTNLVCRLLLEKKKNDLRPG